MVPVSHLILGALSPAIALVLDSAGGMACGIFALPSPSGDRRHEPALPRACTWPSSARTGR